MEWKPSTEKALEFFQKMESGEYKREGAGCGAEHNHSSAAFEEDNFEEDKCLEMG